MAYQSEIEKLEQRYRENPQQWFAALADSYRKAGSIDLALDVVRSGLEKRPNYVSGHIVHGRCLIDQQKDAEALRVFERVLELDAENVIAIKVLAEIGERTGQADVARRWLNRLLEVDPANEDAQEIIARLAESAPAAEPTAAPPAAAAPAVETALSAAGELLADIAEPALVPAAAPAGPAPVAPTPVAGFEATMQESPPADEAFAVELPEDAFAVERMEEAVIGADAASVPTVEMEPVSLQSRLPDVEVEAEDAALPVAGPEPVDTVEPAPAEVEVSPAGMDVMPFDDTLAWGTGERMSREITVADIEAAEHAHEASLDATVHALPGLESAELPPADVVPAVEGHEEASAPLPLIFPEESPPAAPVVPPAARIEAFQPSPGLGVPEPEPVVTETMAELYAQQGLLEEARDTYRKLLNQRPGDPGLEARLAALEPGAKRVVAPARRPQFAAETGGQTVRDFLSDVFGGRSSGGAAAGAAVTSEPLAPRVVPSPPPPPPPPASRATPPPRRPAAAPSEPTVMEAAFEKGEPSAGSGEPTRRASDEVSLAAVFGEEPPPPKVAPPPSAPRGGPAGAGEKGFSFDEFFGTQRQPRDSTPEKGDDDFKRWLKSLKS